MKYFQKSLKWYEKKCLRNYYKSIKETPIFNWFEFQDTNDFSFLLKKGKVNKHKFKAFRMLQNEFIEVFGFDPKALELFRKKIDLQIMKNDIALTGDKSNQMFVDMLEIEIVESSPKDDEERNYLESVIAVEQMMKFKLNLKETTVFEFYSYIKQLKKRNGIK